MAQASDLADVRKCDLDHAPRFNGQQAKVDRRHDKEVHGTDASRMIAQEVLLRLADPPGWRLGMYLATVD